MSLRLENLVERMIQHAQKNAADCENLKGQGKPIPKEQTGNSPDALGLKVLANAGFVPDEVRLRQELAVLEDWLAGLPKARSGIRPRRVAQLQMSVAVQAESRK